MGRRLATAHTRGPGRTTLVSGESTAVEAALSDWALRDRAAALRLFVPEARPHFASARIALGHALRESAWMGSDTRVNDAKSGWWLEELALSARAAPRHPLTIFLARVTPVPDFAQLSDAFARLTGTTPDSDTEMVIPLLARLERLLWFGPTDAVPDACDTRARAATVDILQRRGAFDLAARGASAADCAASQLSALRAARAGDAWTAARRAQALAWLEGGARPLRWREIWLVWRAALATRLQGSGKRRSGVEDGA